MVAAFKFYAFRKCACRKFTVPLSSQCLGIEFSVFAVVHTSGSFSPSLVPFGLMTSLHAEIENWYKALYPLPRARVFDEITCCSFTLQN